MSDGEEGFIERAAKWFAGLFTRKAAPAATNATRRNTNVRTPNANMPPMPPAVPINNVTGNIKNEGKYFKNAGSTVAPVQVAQPLSVTRSGTPYGLTGGRRRRRNRNRTKRRRN